MNSTTRIRLATSIEMVLLCYSYIYRTNKPNFQEKKMKLERTGKKDFIKNLWKCKKKIMSTEQQRGEDERFRKWEGLSDRRKEKREVEVGDGRTERTSTLFTKSFFRESPEARVWHWHSIMHRVMQTQRNMSHLLKISGSQHTQKEAINQLLTLESEWSWLLKHFI